MDYGYLVGLRPVADAMLVTTASEFEWMCFYRGTERASSLAVAVATKPPIADQKFSLTVRRISRHFVPVLIFFSGLSPAYFDVSGGACFTNLPQIRKILPAPSLGH